MRGLPVVLLSLLGAATACDPKSGGTPDGGDPFAAPHSAPPQVLNLGGPVLSAPEVVPIFFANDNTAMTAEVADFLREVGGSNYWLAAMQEYGIGRVTSTAPVTLTETVSGSMTSDDIAAWLAGRLNANDPQFPAPGPETIYALNYPAGVTIMAQNGSMTEQSCVELGGYHDEVQLDSAHHNMQVVYLVIPRCVTFDGNTGIQEITGAESHELLESSTDPFPMSAPAWAQVDQAHLFWEATLGGEIADLCEADPEAFVVYPDLPFLVQRFWSNQSANADHDPCVVVPPGEVYFNTVPVLDDTVPITFGTQTTTTSGVMIPVGQSRTIDLELYSDAPTPGPWTVQVQGVAGNTVSSQYLSFALDKPSGQNGDVIHLTINVLQAGPSNAETFVITSSLGQTASYVWFGYVGN